MNGRGRAGGACAAHEEGENGQGHRPDRRPALLPVSQHGEEGTREGKKRDGSQILPSLQDRPAVFAPRPAARPPTQFQSTVKKKLEKKKNAMAAKFYLLFKIAQPFSPGGAGVPTEITRTMHLQLQKVIDDQLKYVNGWLSVSEQKARSQDRGLAPNSSMIKDIIQEYIITKDLLNDVLDHGTV